MARDCTEHDMEHVLIIIYCTLQMKSRLSEQQLNSNEGEFELNGYVLHIDTKLFII